MKIRFSIISRLLISSKRVWRLWTRIPLFGSDPSSTVPWRLSVAVLGRPESSPAVSAESGSFPKAGVGSALASASSIDMKLVLAGIPGMLSCVSSPILIELITESLARTLLSSVLSTGEMLMPLWSGSSRLAPLPAILVLAELGISPVSNSNSTSKSPLLILSSEALSYIFKLPSPMPDDAPTFF